jgi:hypothetical protein
MEWITSNPPVALPKILHGQLLPYLISDLPNSCTIEH